MKKAKRLSLPLIKKFIVIARLKKNRSVSDFKIVIVKRR
jgi:hypothetical protein